MKRAAFDLSQPIIMVWRDIEAEREPWRFKVRFNGRWFDFENVKFGSKGTATRIARNALDALREKAQFKIL